MAALSSTMKIVLRHSKPGAYGLSLLPNGFDVSAAVENPPSLPAEMSIANPWSITVVDTARVTHQSSLLRIPGQN